MRFKLWFENQLNKNRGNSTPASDEAIYTKMQPQINDQKIKKRGPFFRPTLKQNYFRSSFS